MRLAHEQAAGTPRKGNFSRVYPRSIPPTTDIIFHNAIGVSMFPLGT
jgi:hypothetical protein